MRRPRRGHALHRRYGRALQRSVCGEFLTRTGKIGATIRCLRSGDRVTYSYIGAWGAGSGHPASYMRTLVADWRANKRGMRETIPFTEGGAQ
jgi:hypothetical protein